jgi:galactose mutarotase-like enzyme
MDYSLSNDKLDVTFKSKGGTLKSIKNKEGLEYLWQGDPAFWSGQAPILFPICGSIRNDTASVGNGKTMSMPRHGIIRKKEFSMEEKTKDRIVFSICSDEESNKQFPYDYKVSEIFTLKDSTITVTYRVENIGTEKMPFFVGGHPAFCCPLEAGERFEDYHVKFPQKETCSTPDPVPGTGLQNMHQRTPLMQDSDDLPLSYALFANDARVLDNLGSRRATLVSSVSGKGVRLDFADFRYLLLWNNKEGRFLAMEPWTGLSTTTDEDDVFEHKNNVQYAMPAESREYTYSITIF